MSKEGLEKVSEIMQSIQKLALVLKDSKDSEDDRLAKMLFVLHNKATEYLKEVLSTGHVEDW